MSGVAMGGLRDARRGGASLDVLMRLSPISLLVFIPHLWTPCPSLSCSSAVLTELSYLEGLTSTFNFEIHHSLKHDFYKF